MTQHAWIFPDSWRNRIVSNNIPWKKISFEIPTFQTSPKFVSKCSMHINPRMPGEVNYGHLGENSNPFKTAAPCFGKENSIHNSICLHWWKQSLVPPHLKALSKHATELLLLLRLIFFVVCHLKISSFRLWILPLNSATDVSPTVPTAFADSFKLLGLM